LCTGRQSVVEPTYAVVPRARLERENCRRPEHEGAERILVLWVRLGFERIALLAPLDFVHGGAEGRCPGNERRAVESLTVRPRGEESLRRQAGCEELAGCGERRFAVFTEALYTAASADVLRQLEILVAEIAAGPGDRLAGAMRRLQCCRERERIAVDRDDRDGFLVQGVAEKPTALVTVTLVPPIAATPAVLVFSAPGEMASTGMTVQ